MFVRPLSYLPLPPQRARSPNLFRPQPRGSSLLPRVPSYTQTIKQAIWAVNFLTVANAKPYPLLRHLGMLLPAAGVFLFNTLSVKTSSLLLAISAMDPEIIGKVIELRP